jgi:hypothetical protein
MPECTRVFITSASGVAFWPGASSALSLLRLPVRQDHFARDRARTRVKERSRIPELTGERLCEVRASVDARFDKSVENLKKPEIGDVGLRATNAERHPLSGVTMGVTLNLSYRKR